MKIVVFSDTHVAKIWDKIDKVIPPEDTDVLNPNETLKDILKKIDKTNLVVINGDIVDYFYTSYLHFRNSNWRVFRHIIEDFKGQVLLNKGNHDYRKAPYNFGIYGLKHINISDYTRRLFKKKIGFSKFRFLKELQSIWVDIKEFNTFERKSFLSRYKKTYSFKNSRLLFLNTGPDALTSIRILVNPFNWFFILRNPTTSFGLSNRDLDLLEEELAKNNGRELIVFLHCAPFQSLKKIPKIKLKKSSYFKNLKKYGLLRSFFIRNNWRFVDILMKSKTNITVITSHSHIPNQYLINKKRKELRDSSMYEINEKRDNPNFVKFISTYPMGAIEKGFGQIGYLVIEDKKIKYKIIKKYKSAFLKIKK